MHHAANQHDTQITTCIGCIEAVQCICLSFKLANALVLITYLFVFELLKVLCNSGGMRRLAVCSFLVRNLQVLVQLVSLLLQLGGLQ